MSDDLALPLAAGTAPMEPDGPVSGLRTFLIADVRGYTSFTQRFGDERAAALVARFAEVTREVVGDGGTVLELRGDEALCVFASPRTALRAAAALQQRFVEEAERDPDLPLLVGIGIDVGEAVAVEGGYRGGALNLAARLCSLARPGEILATTETVHLAQRVSGLSYRPHDTVPVKGLDEPVRVVRIVPDGDDPVRRLAALRGPPPEPPETGGPRWLPRRLRRRPVLAVGAIVTAVAAAVAATVVAVSLSRPHEPTSFGENVAGSIDAATGAVTGQVPLFGTPTALAAGAGVVWAVDTDDNSVGRIDLASRRLDQTTDVGAAPTSVAVGGDSVWVANSTSGTVTRIDPRIGRVRQTVTVRGTPTAVAFDHGALWVVDQVASMALRVDPTNLQITDRVPVGDGPSAIVAGGGLLWVSNSGDGTVTPIDPVHAIGLPSVRVGSDPRGMAVDGGSLWVADNLDNTVTRVAMDTGLVGAAIGVGKGPVAVAVASGKVWVANQEGASISEIDPARSRVVATIGTASQPADVVSVGTALWVAAGPRPALHRGGTFRALIGPQFGTGPADFDAGGTPAQRMMYDGLVAQRQAPGSAGYLTVPDLALGLPAVSDAGLTYTFRLRPGLRWSTGAPVTGEDVRRGIERAIARGVSDLSIDGAATCTPDACDLRTGVAVDDRTGTVTIHLSEPQPEFVSGLTDAVAVPSSTPLTAVSGPLPATGPYQAADYRPDASLTLIRNPHFTEWSHAAQPAGFPDRFEFTIDPEWDAHADADAGRTGFDWIDVRGADIGALQAREPDRVKLSPRLSVRYAFLNTRVPPFDVPAARQAVSYAIDRGAIKDDWAGPATIACQVVPPSVPGYRPYCPYTLRSDESGTWYAPDVAAAQRLVQQSGTAGATVTVVTPPLNQRPMQDVVDAMRSIGYDARLVVIPGNVYFGGYLQAHPELQAGFIGWIGTFPSAFQFTEVSTCADIPLGKNFASFCDPSVDALMTSALNIEARSQQAAGDAWAQVDKTLTDDAPLVPLVVESNAVLLSARVRHYEVEPAGGILDQAWLR